MTRRLTSITNADDQQHQTYEEGLSARRVTLVNGSASSDTFNRLRVSEPLTLFDSKQLHDNQPLFWDDQEVSGSGTTSSHSTDTASTTIGVGVTTAGKRVRQTFQRFNYQPGKSQLIFLTGVIGVQGPGIAARMGLFDDENGIFLVNTGTIAALGIRSYTSGSAVDDLVTQSNWNLDTMDGTGPSGVSLDFDKCQIMVIDFEWLGVGSVRVGFVVDAAIIYCHVFHHANTVTDVYMSTPNLPLRYEIENDGTGNAATLKHICSTVISEGGLAKTGILQHSDSGSVSSLQSGTLYAVIGIRLKSTHLDASVLLENLSVIATSTNDQLHWELLWNPTVAGTFTYADVTDSACQIATGASTNTVTGGYEMDGGYVTTSIPVSPSAPNALKLGSKIDGTRDTIVLCVRPITNNITVQASLTWRELS